MHGKYYFQFGTFHLCEIGAHWKSATLNQFVLDQFLLFVVWFGVFFQVTVLNNLLNYFDFLI